MNKIKTKPHFVCDLGDWDIQALKAFTINSGTIVIIRGYAEIEDGKITFIKMVH